MLTKILIGFALTLALAGGIAGFGNVDGQEQAPGNDVRVSGVDSSTYEDRSRSFEQWVLSRFGHDHHTLKQWPANDPQVKDLQPDRMMAMHLGSREFSYMIECKWRISLMGINADLTPDRIQRYKRFALDHQMPIFLILGVGGEPAAPEEVYVIPLSRIDPEKLKAAALAPYRQRKNDKLFYYNPIAQVLSL